MSTLLIFVPYIISTVSNISTVCLLLLLLYIAFLGVYSLAAAVEDTPNKLVNYLIKSTAIKVILVSFLTISILLPSKSTMYQMLAIWGGIEIVQSDVATRLAPKTLEVLENMMDEYLEENANGE